MINRKTRHTRNSHVKFLLSLLLAATFLITALPVYAAEDAAPMAEDAAVETEDATPVAEETVPDLDALLSEQASEYVTITVYDRSTYTFGPIQLVDGFRYPTDADREMRIKGSGTSSNNIRIQSIKWLKRNSEGEYIEDTSGWFTEGTWRCEMLLNGVSSSNIYDWSSGYGDIRFEGFPDGTTWTGNGNSSGNITFHTMFYVKYKENLSEVNLLLNEGSVKILKLGGKISDYIPDYSLEQDDIDKGIRIADIYYVKQTDPDAPWPEWKRVSSSGVFEFGNYCLVIKLTCSNVNYKFDAEEVEANVNHDESFFSSETLDDGSVLIGDTDTVNAIKDGLVYRVEDCKKHTVFLLRTHDKKHVPSDLVIPETIHIRGTKYTVSTVVEAFSYYDNMNSAYVPASVESLSLCSFYINSIKSISFEEGSNCKKIGSSCFFSCDDLKEITLPGKTELIDSNAFSQCTSLEKIIIPASVKTIEYMAFQDCTALKDVYYTGTKAQWEEVNIKDNHNECLLNANIHYNCKSINDCTITIPAQTYTGNVLKPAPTVTYKGKTLKSGTDYTVSYKNNKNPGRAMMTIKGKGSYYGTQLKPFTIAYKDVPSTHGYATGVYWATNKGIAAGYTGSKAGNFGVKDDITRGQVVTFLWRAAGKPLPSDTTTQTFKDVPTSHNFYLAIQWAAEEGIAGGYSGSRKGYFGPNDNCTRGQIAMFLWRYVGKPEPMGSEQTFSDVPTGHDFYKAIQWASEWKVTAGNSDGSFGINKTCTRGQCATFLYRMPDDNYYFTD